jgi:predicted peroxiredoxin
MKILQIVESAYRATLEEQDDTILWLSHALKNAGAEISIVLKSNAVNYAIRSSSELPDLANLGIQHPPKFAADLEKMAAKGVPIYAWQMSLKDRGISNEQLVESVRPVEGPELSRLMEQHDYVLHW